MKANNVKYMLYEGSRSAADALYKSIDTRWKVMVGSTQIRALLSCISIRDEAEAKDDERKDQHLYEMQEREREKSRDGNKEGPVTRPKVAAFFQLLMTWRTRDAERKKKVFDPAAAAAATI